MAFTSGLTVTVNNFIVKATGVDFGELMAVRGLMQMPVMFTIIALQGKIETDAKKYYWPRNKLLLKNPPFLPNLQETW